MGRGDSKPSSRDQSEEVSSSEHSDDEDAPKVSGEAFLNLVVTLHGYISITTYTGRFLNPLL